MRARPLVALLIGVGAAVTALSAACAKDATGPKPVSCWDACLPPEGKIMGRVPCDDPCAGDTVRLARGRLPSPLSLDSGLTE